MIVFQVFNILIYNILFKQYLMTIKIGKNSGKEIVKILEEKLKRTGKSGNLEKHFGKLKRNLDGLDYQNEMRENES